MEGLEKIDSETDNLDITFIKINDPRYARKYGVTKLPALVYFRKKFPSIYRGKILFSECTVHINESIVLHKTEAKKYLTARCSIKIDFLIKTRAQFI